MAKKGNYCYEYPRPAVATDCVVFGYKGADLEVLLIERGSEPFQGEWAFPGGFLEMDEDAAAGARRELCEETGLDLTSLEQLYTFSEVNRDPRGRVVSIVYFTLIPLDGCEVKGGDDARQARWFSLDRLPPLAFDHTDVLKRAMDRLREKIRLYPDGAQPWSACIPVADLRWLTDLLLTDSVK